MLNHHHTSRRCLATVALLVVFAMVPATAGARPIDGPGMPHPDSAQTTPTIVRTVVKEDAVSVLPIALASVALLVAIVGTGYVLFRTAPLRRQLGVGH